MIGIKNKNTIIFFFRLKFQKVVQLDQKKRVFSLNSLK